MLLKVLGSNSSGNCYVLDNGNEALVIECGVKLQEVKKALNFDISRIVGVILSHEHGDHAKFVKDFIDARIPVFTSKGTAEALKLKIGTTCNHKVEFKKFKVGNFIVKPFKVEHDAKEPFGYLINHKETGTILFATDTVSIPYTFQNLNNILIECNHSIGIVEEKLHAGIITEAQSVRVLRNHLSLETCLNVLLDNDLSNVNNIVLLHLSDKNSDSDDFRQRVQFQTGKTVYIAKKNLIINFDKTPF